MKRIDDDVVIQLTHNSDQVLSELAREVERDRALRPDCPTCKGSGLNPAMPPGIKTCPDCKDGKMPLDKWVALLVKTLRDLRNDQISHQSTVMFGAKPHSSPADAVLKMVPK